MSDWTFHGGRIAEARAIYGGEDWLDLSTGINPYSWPGANSLTIDWQRLPDEHARAELEATAASFFGVSPAHICALPGTEIGLRLLGDLLPGGAHHIAPSYRTHAAMCDGARPIMLDAAQAGASGTLILANPNNPDGRLLDRTASCALLDAQRAAGHWLVIDEAFADPHPDHSMGAQIADDAPLIVFRSFGKFFGLAGLRLGFVLGPRNLIARYRDKLGAWPLSSAAIAIGTAAYRDADWIATMRWTLRTKAEALDAILIHHGFTPQGACPLFRLIDTDAAVLFDRLAQQAILTRPFDYDPRWLRIGLPGGAEARDRLDRALADG